MTEKEQIKAEIEGRIALAEKCAEAACEKNLHSALEANEMLIRQYKSLLAFIESLPDENNPEPYNPVYDEDYLNEKIAKATKSWEGVDVDAMLADCRGYEEKPSEDLEEAAENIYKTPFGTRAEDFQAGAEWQKEQDQPITGNSLEQEWLRYVEKKKKECRGELPSLGEYGWLRIARHFANWQKKQMLKNAMEVDVDDLNGEIYNNCIEKGMTGKDKVKIIILKDGE